MSIFFNRETKLSGDWGAVRFASRGKARASVDADRALMHSAVWACLRLRADLVSSTPLDVFRMIDGQQVEVAKPPVLVAPGGERMTCGEWIYSSQFDLDRFGNVFGIITQRDGAGLPARIDLQPTSDVVVRVIDGEISEFKIAGRVYQPRDVWHEKQFTVPGMAVGLSPIMHAAWSLGTYLSAQEFAHDWFPTGAAPTGQLRNTQVQTVNEDDAEKVKGRFKRAVEDRDIFVTGRDWEFNFHQVPANTVMFLEEMKFGIGDAARFLGVPGDMIDAESSTGSVTYANVTQRNLQLLTINLGPAFKRREDAFSAWMLPRPRFAKFNTDAVLRMDPLGRSQKLIAEVAGRLRSPSEARALENLPPFNETQLAEFDRLFGIPRPPSANGATA